MLKVYFIGGTQNIHGDRKRFIQQLTIACQSGITMFQYREKDHSALSGTERLALGKQVREITRKAAIPLIVDDDLKLAQAIDADGIHVGQSDTPVQEVVKKASGMIVGLSVHNRDELIASGDLTGVDYLGVGPIFATNSKENAKQPIGLDGLFQMNQATLKPIVAIGGIHEDNVGEVLKHSVSGVAVISDIMESDDIPLTVRHLKGEA
ncbi:thiamine phosphate synthase (plasmid) [Nicoliella spurrieriana]|uniref:Thiamine-phosphate synthase n=2 Tax=Nicoliella spurrieriana TaxID=2925830 RepID=A0A976RQF4_9LACO|nr:thiamine phosphate synthase [Nicoliella spurrieriana]